MRTGPPRSMGSGLPLRRSARKTGVCPGGVSRTSLSESELAKRFFGFYIARSVTSTSRWTGAQFAALVVFVLWMYYMSMVFPVGGVLAERVEARRMQRRQRALLGETTPQR